MIRTKLTTAAVGLAGALAASHAYAQSASGGDQEIALLKQQLRLLEQKLGGLQKQTAANTAAAANAKAEAKVEQGRKRKPPSPRPMRPFRSRAPSRRRGSW